jgi:hypothetical protein
VVPLSNTFHHTLFLFVAGATLLSFTAQGIHRPAVPEAPTDRLTEVINALKSGNAEQLSKYFGSYVDVTLPDKKVVCYSKKQAVMVLSDFFETYKVKNFSMQTRGDGETAKYCTGTLQTAGGIFQTTMFIRKDGDLPMIKEINLAFK